ncbi:hypothetical protein M409DRAFT_64534 [Zasmidium cellare ATCC 36951]|uniref:H-type lectin domain-containing protein n=1 Tax=Zasmidium cellare ATCC 36951 TaxID=1080233 RepID=A0A6A6CWM0_ZASCE|nr:uncharacterized protein M409DRAFT_64534 [Zasmidium cellare ATCC 36951]KAF2170199.1 hypothetical protein M409DRAFT_64534 [Zasmidium cellare ATCC 36951]
MDGLSNPNLFLDDGTQGFTHVKDAGPDNGTFALSEVREDTRQADRGGSRIIALPKDRYQKPPQLAKGLKACNLNYQSRDRDGNRAIDLELNIATHPRNASTIRPIIQARNSSNSTQLLYDAEMSWMEAKQGAKDCIIMTTKWDLAAGEKKKRVDFPREFDRDAEVLCWIKDFRFLTYDGSPYSVDVWASDVTPKGFTANASGSRCAERLGVTWIVYYKGKNKVASGSFSTEDVEDREDEQPENAGRVEFAAATFSKPPTVLVGLSQFDHAGSRDLKLGVYVTAVDESGFDWQLNTWGENSNDALRSAEATYVALDFV